MFQWWYIVTISGSELSDCWIHDLSRFGRIRVTLNFEAFTVSDDCECFEVESTKLYESYRSSSGTVNKLSIELEQWSNEQFLEHLISNKFIRRSTLEHEVVSRPYGDSQELSTKTCESPYVLT